MCPKMMMMMMMMMMTEATEASVIYLRAHLPREPKTLHCNGIRQAKFISFFCQNLSKKERNDTKNARKRDQNLISTSEWCAEHSFTGQNIKQMLSSNWLLQRNLFKCWLPYG
jgi:hypothetical protein